MNVSIPLNPWWGGLGALAVLVGLVGSPAFGQGVPVEDTAAAGGLRAAATAVEGAPAMDGDVLGDPAWAEAVPVTGFRVCRACLTARRCKSSAQVWWRQRASEAQGR